MDLREAILEKHSKTQTDKIVNWIGNNQERFDTLFKLFLKDEEIVEQRAAWALSNAVMNHPKLINKHFGQLIKKIKQPGIHNAVIRNGIRLMEECEIPGKYHGEVMNLCFDFISDPREKPAIKAFSLTVLQKLSYSYPDIKNELKIVIESQWENESAAFRSRARKILKELS